MNSAQQDYMLQIPSPFPNILLSSECGAATTISPVGFSSYATVYSCRHPCQLSLIHMAHSSQGTFPPFRLLEELAKAGQPPHKARTCLETDLLHLSPQAGQLQVAAKLPEDRTFWPGSCICGSLELCENTCTHLLPLTAAIWLLLSDAHSAPKLITVPG